MLVLSRKEQERIHIGDNITLTIGRIKGGRVRLCIEAPPEVLILRGELPRFSTVAPDVEDVMAAVAADS